MYTPRYLEDTIERIHRTFKVLYVGGPRQVGKTTLLQHLAKKHHMQYVTLDDLSARNLAQTDPGLFLQQYEAPLFIDEVQYAPLLFSEIKRLVDRQPKNGRYWLTGSQQFAMIRNLQESLTGRVAIVNLLGFSSAELYRVPKQPLPFTVGANQKHAAHWKASDRTIFERIWRGSFPSLWTKEAPDPSVFFTTYIQTYVDRDLRVLYGIEKTGEFHLFLQICAARTGQWLNYSDLARDAGVSVPTAKAWLSILEQTMFIFLLRPYHTNRIKRLVKSPKLYFLDTGLAAFLMKWRSSETLAHGAMAGAFFETFVASEVIKSYLFRGEEPPLFAFRDAQGHEVDLIIERAEGINPVEIKRSVHVSLGDLGSIAFVRKKIPQSGRSAVLCLAEKPLSISRTTEVLPIGVIS